MITKEVQLKAMKIGELRARLRHIGASWSAKESKTDIIARLMELESAAQPSDKHEEAKPAASTKTKPSPPPKLTQAEVLEALDPLIKRGLRIGFPPDGNCWMMGFGNKLDSGNLQMPLKTIMRCAALMLPPEA